MCGVRKTLDGTSIDWNIPLRYTRNTSGTFETWVVAEGEFFFSLKKAVIFKPTRKCWVISRAFAKLVSEDFQN